MKTARRPSTLVKALFKVPVWMYQAHLGFLFFGSLIVIVHRGRKSGNRYVTGLEMIDRRDDELFVLSLWGAKSDWYRNIEANGVDELWDGTKRTGACSGSSHLTRRLASFPLPRKHTNDW